jgi:hypothetical protein
MRKAILLARAAVVGSVLGVLVFIVIDQLFHPPFAVGEQGVWTEYGFLILGGGGAICRVIISWPARLGSNKPRTLMSAPGAVPPATVSTQPRRNSRPLTWLYRV